MSIRSIFMFLAALMVLFPASLFAVKGTYKGTVKEAKWVTSELGEPCSVHVSYDEENPEAIHVMMTAGEKGYTGGPLSPSFSGSNEYDPKYNVDWRNGQEVPENQLVLYVFVEDTKKVKGVSAFKGDMSESGFEYAISCEDLTKD